MNIVKNQSNRATVKIATEVQGTLYSTQIIIAIIGTSVNQST
jgi:hypothetical protein